MTIRFFSMTPPVLVLVAAWSVTLAGSGQARPFFYKDNVREACRKELAGAYLTVYDARERDRILIRSLTDKIQELEIALKSATADQAGARQAARDAPFDVDLAARASSADAKVNTLQARLSEFRTQVVSTQEEYQAAVEGEKSLRTMLEKVFVFERVEDRPNGGYPVHLAYRHACPKYRHLCPLPKPDAEKLLTIRIDGKVPETCTRYAGLSRIGPRS